MITKNDLIEFLQALAIFMILYVNYILLWAIVK